MPFETTEPNQIRPDPTEPDRTRPNPTGPDQTQPDPTESNRTEVPNRNVLLQVVPVTVQ
jgi:hypothetical protein